jgi:PAP2 superfamily
MQKITQVLSIFAFSLILLTTGCKPDGSPADPTANADAYSSDTPRDWFDLERKLVKETPGFTPPVAARAYAYTTVAFYEAVVQGSTKGKSLAGQIQGLNSVPQREDGKRYHWAACGNAALAEIMRSLFPTANAANLQLITDLENQYRTQAAAQTDAETMERSVAFGKTMGKAIYAYSVTDNQNLCYTTNFPASYVVPVGNGFWVPTAPNQKALQPYWGNVRTFLGVNSYDIKVAAPLPFSIDAESAFYQEGMEVYNTVQNLQTPERDIAKYWSDDPGLTGTPSGHSISILTQLLKTENTNLTKAAEAYVKLGMSLHDAFVCCWKTKYTYNLMRPISYIQQNIDPAFTTVLNTPPFPEYTSGHSVQSGAMATVLTSVFGTRTFTDRTHAARTDINGAPRTYSSFKACAEEAAISRLYGGIHYRRACGEGIKQGEQIGANIITRIAFRRY